MSKPISKPQQGEGRGQKNEAQIETKAIIVQGQGQD